MKNEFYCVWCDVSRFLGLEWLAEAKRVKSRDTMIDVTAPDNASKFYEIMGGTTKKTAFVVRMKHYYTILYDIQQMSIYIIVFNTREACTIHPLALQRDMHGDSVSYIPSINQAHVG